MCISKGFLSFFTFKSAFEYRITMFCAKIPVKSPVFALLHFILLCLQNIFCLILAHPKKGHYICAVFMFYNIEKVKTKYPVG